MATSKASWPLRAALKRRSRRWRRREVVTFYFLMLVSLLATLGADHHGFSHFGLTVCWLVIAIGEGKRWRLSQQRWVTSLDDRAQVEHGMNFEQLSAAEQKEILRRYRLGRFLLDWTEDERQQASRMRANEAAFRFLRIALPCFAAAYWMVYLWMPAGAWRECLMDSPVLISWLVVFVISLPPVLEMWTEPDEAGEARAVLPHAGAAN